MLVRESRTLKRRCMAELWQVVVSWSVWAGQPVPSVAVLDDFRPRSLAERLEGSPDKKQNRGTTQTKTTGTELARTCESAANKKSSIS